MSQSWWMHFSLPYCLSSHMVTAQTEIEWVNYRNHSHTSIQVICGRVWIESRLLGLSLKISCYNHICGKRRTGKQHQWHSRRRNGRVWSYLLCGSPLSTHCLIQGCLCFCAGLTQGLSVIQQSSQCTEHGTDAKVPLSKSIGTVSFNR